MSAEKGKFPAIIPTRANTGNPSGNMFRDSFSSDDEFIKWILCSNTALNKKVEQQEIELKISERLLAERGGAGIELRESARAFVLFDI